MKVKNMINSNGNYVPNQFVISNENTVTFQSYDSTIATINYATKEIVIYPDWDYSKTTSKYRNLFFNDNGFYNLSTSKGIKEAIKKKECKGYKIVMAQ